MEIGAPEYEAGLDGSQLIPVNELSGDSGDNEDDIGTPGTRHIPYPGKAPRRLDFSVSDEEDLVAEASEVDLEGYFNRYDVPLADRNRS